MRAVDRHVLFLYGLLIVVAVIIHVPRRWSSQGEDLPLDRLVETPEGWQGVDGVPEAILPVDERAVETIRRTYTSGERRVWFSIARYHSRNDPRQRPSLERVVVERGAISVVTVPVQLDLREERHGPVWVNRAAVDRMEGPVWVLYWFHLGSRPISDQYRLRLALFIESLRAREEPLLLVRAAGNSSDAASAFARTYYPSLERRIMARNGRRDGQS